MQNISKFHLAIAVLCLITSISSYVLPDSGEGDGFDEKCLNNNDPDSPMNMNECSKMLDETSTDYTGTNYTLPTTTAATTTVHSDKVNTTVSSSPATVSNSSTSTTTPSSPVTQSTASTDNNGITKPTIVLTADHLPTTTAKSPTQVVIISSTTEPTIVSTSSSKSGHSAPISGSSSGSVPVAFSAAALIGLLTVATFLQK